jgi:hypothetical protein
MRNWRSWISTPILFDPELSLGQKVVHVAVEVILWPQF